MQISMVDMPRNILILIILILALQIPVGLAQTPTQLSLTLVGQSGEQYLTPVGRTTELKMEILNVAPSDLYLVHGFAYLDPNMNGTWQLTHSEDLGGFHLSYLQSAIWTFSLTMPPEIQAANVTDGVPQVDLLIKVAYLVSGGPQRVEQGLFPLGVPGATVRGANDLIWLLVAGTFVVIFTFSVSVVCRTRKRSRAR